MAEQRATGRRCVTCQFWSGPRKISYCREKAEYASDSTNGECTTGAWNRKQKPANSTCGSWEKWSMIQQAHN